jgi:hypothetical protein
MTATLPAPPPRSADPWAAHPARIERIVDEIPGVRTYEIVPVEPALRGRWRFAAGQFNMLQLPGIGEAAISISSDADEPDVLAHTIRAVGNVTDALARLGPGAELLLRGPFGRPWPDRELAGRDVVIVAGGLGLASQRAAVYRLARTHAACRSATLLLGAKRPEGLLYAAEHESWRRAGIDVVPVVDAPAPGWSGRTGLVTGLLEELPLDPTRATILCCGPDQMIGAVAAVALRRGVAAEAIFVSLERNMGCGFGHCGLCQLGPFFVCHDGPVFRWDRVAPLLAVPGL